MEELLKYLQVFEAIFELFRGEIFLEKIHEKSLPDILENTVEVFLETFT